MTLMEIELKPGPAAPDRAAVFRAVTEALRPLGHHGAVEVLLNLLVSICEPHGLPKQLVLDLLSGVWDGSLERSLEAQP